MKLLLDTHAVLWWLSGDARLGDRVRDLIADPGNAILVSVASLWEIVVKIRIGKLSADIAAISDALERQGIVLLGIAPGQLVTLATLPRLPEHRDPFDHLLIAQAIAEGAVLVTDDRSASRYPVTILTCSGRSPGASSEAAN